MATTLRIPGLIDAHVHLREPGGVHKEDAYSGTLAALAGGVVGVLDMPNNTPPIVGEDTFLAKQRVFEAKAVSDYGLFVGSQGDGAPDWGAAASHAVGLKLYLDETFGDLLTRDVAGLDATFERWPGPGPVAVHADSGTIPAALELARRHSQRIHICHVPHPDDLLRIDEARQAGIDVTCEVTPHHLFLAAESVGEWSAFRRMKPPLVPEAQVRLFWERLHLVDIIATDHAPHTVEEKQGPNPPPGVPGLETLLPLMLYAVDQGWLSLERLLELAYYRPLQVYRLRPPDGASVEVALDTAHTLPFRGYHTRCDWSAFAGCRALGRVQRVHLHDHLVWEAGRLLAEPGSGRPLRPMGSAGAREEHSLG